MDVVEKIFGFAAKRWQQRRHHQQRRRNAGRTATLDEALPTVLAFLGSASGESGIVVRDAVGIGAVYPGTVLLPLAISRHESREANLKAYLHKALVAGTIHRHRLAFPPGASTPEARFAAMRASRGIVQDALRREFPGYDEFFGGLLAEWAIPEEHVAWVELMRAGAKAVLPEQAAIDGSSRKKSEDQGSELRGRSPSEVEVVDLAKQKGHENPVLHSFEKLETADDYQGGYRVQDGADQLQDHAGALEELDMKSVTRDGDAAASTYQASIADLLQAPDAAAAGARYDSYVTYPEWDFRARRLKPDHCRIYQPAVEASATDAEPSQLTDIAARHRSELDSWGSLLDSLLNECGWRDRQFEGPELSVDAFVRYVSDMREAGIGDPRLFARKTRKTQNFSSLILLDQSLSTDSWVQNRRVLDVEVEAIQMISLLFEHLSASFAVAGCASETRNHCYFYWYKQFQDQWSSFHRHASSVEPKGYTRLGPAIRHATSTLVKQPGRERLLILLTDGKPTDHDRYEGRYGVHDIHHAILEARQRGVHVKAFAIEADAKYYFPLMFGVGNYQILLDVAKLPEALFKLYWEVLSR